MLRIGTKVKLDINSPINQGDEGFLDCCGLVYNKNYIVDLIVGEAGNCRIQLEGVFGYFFVARFIKACNIGREDVTGRLP